MKHINKFLLIAVLSVMGMATFGQPYTITLNANGGSGGTTISTINALYYVKNEKDKYVQVTAPFLYYTADNISNPTPASNSYKFDGWYKNDDETKVIFDFTPVYEKIGNKTYTARGYKVGASTPINSNTTLYAHWTNKAPKPVITFNLNGGVGTNPTANLTHTIGYAGGAQTNTYKLDKSVAEPTRTGYNFAGWYTDATAGTQVIINTLNEITNWSSLGISVGNTTFYAHWTPRVSQTLTLIDYVNNTNATDTYYELPEPTYANLTFDGWYDANGTKCPGITSSSPAANTTLYAQWTYKVEFINGNNTYKSFSATPFKKLADDDGIEVTTTDVSGPTGNFAGWFTAATGGVKVTLPRTYTGNAKVYAQFGKTCQITRMDFTKATIDQKNTNSSGKLADSDLGKSAGTDPTGKVFDGWYTQVSGGEKVTSSTVFTSDAAIYARWLYASYTIKYTTGEFPEGYSISMGQKTESENYIDIQTVLNVSGSFTIGSAAPSASGSGTTIDFTQWRVRGSSKYYDPKDEVFIADVRQFAQLDVIYLDATWDCNTTVVPTVTVPEGAVMDGNNISLAKGNNYIDFKLPGNDGACWYFRDGVNEDTHGGSEEVVPHNDIYIVLDVSSSMNRKLGGTVTTAVASGELSRIEASKAAIKNLLEIIVEKESDTRVLLLTYTGNVNIGFPFDGVTATNATDIMNYAASASMPAITAENIATYKAKVDAIATDRNTPTAASLYWIKKVIQEIQKKTATSRNSYAFMFTDGEPYVGSNSDGSRYVQVAEAINQAAIIKGSGNVQTNATCEGYYGVQVNGASTSADKATKWLDIRNWNNAVDGTSNNAGNYTRTETGLNTTIYTVGMVGANDYKKYMERLFEGVASPGCNLGNVDGNVLGDLFSNMFSGIETETYQRVQDFVYEGKDQDYNKGPFDKCGKFQVQVQYKDGCGNWAKSDAYVVTVSDPALLAPHMHLYCPTQKGVPMSPLTVTKNADNVDITPIKFEYTYTRDGGSPQQKTMSGSEMYGAVEIPYVNNVSVVYYTCAEGYDSDAGCPSQPTSISLVKSTHIVDEEAELSDNSAGKAGYCVVAPVSGFHYVLIGDNKHTSHASGYVNEPGNSAYASIRQGDEFVAGIQTSDASTGNYSGNVLNMWTAVAPVSGLTYEGKDMVMVPRIFQIDNLGSNTAVDMVLPLTKAEINTLWWYMHGDLTQLGLYKIDNATYSVTNGFTVGNNVVITPYDGATSSSSDINSSLAYQFAVANVALPAQANNNAGPANLQNAMGGTGTYYVMGIKSSNLPVELLYFNAECLGNAIRFAWSTATETNNEYFTIERSEDAIHYKEVARIQGAGTSTMQQDYSFMLDNNTGKTMYYRLRQTDIDGLTEVFEPVAVQCDVEESMDVTMYPVPAMNYVTIQSSMNMAEIQIHNVYGALVNRVEANADKVLVDVSNLANGIYTVKITMANGEQVSRKLIKR